METLHIPARWDQLEAVYDFMDAELTRQGCPTILRLRLASVMEELFFSVLDTPDPPDGWFDCSVGPERGVVSCRFTLPESARPDYSGLEAMLERMGNLGLLSERRDGGWTFLLGRRPDPS